MRIGILTGGGDCPGLNAVIRAVVRTSDSRYGSSVVGFQDGWRGLLENRRMQLANDDRNDRLLAKGGTMLGTARVHIGDLVIGHALGNVRIFHAEQAAEAATDIRLFQFRQFETFNAR